MEYREEQKIKSTLVVVLYAFAVLVSLLSIVFVFYQMQKEGVSIREIFWVPAFIICILGAVYYFIFGTTLETDISKEGFGYRYFPILPKRKFIDFNTVVSWRISKTKLMSELGGFGYRKSLFSKKSGYIMHLNEQVEFTLQNGQTKIFSIQNKEMMQSTLRKYVAAKELK